MATSKLNKTWKKSYYDLMHGQQNEGKLMTGREEYGIEENENRGGCNPLNSPDRLIADKGFILACTIWAHVRPCFTCVNYSSISGAICSSPAVVTHT